MIIGIGVDLCSIARIEKAIQSEHFKHRIFSHEEIIYAESKGKRCAESYAASFAAREAFCKASGIDLTRVMFGGNFSLIRDKNGKPKIKLNVEFLPGTKNFVSISHEKEYACAMVVIEKI